MLWLLFLTLPLAGWIFYHFPRRAALHDHKEILANGSSDTLKEWFHFFQAAQRFLFEFWIAGTAAAPVFRSSPIAWAVLTAGIMVAAHAWFTHEFNPILSKLRGLDPYYVSFSSRAAYFPDRLLASRAQKRYAVLGDNSFADNVQRQSASRELKSLLATVLWVGLLVGTMLIGSGIILASNLR